MVCLRINALPVGNFLGSICYEKPSKTLYSGYSLQKYFLHDILDIVVIEENLYLEYNSTL